MDAAENDFPRSFMKPRCSSSAEISRSDLWPPFGPTSAQLTDQGDKLGVHLRVRFTTFALAVERAHWCRI
jgi:hypothetical protein